MSTHVPPEFEVLVAPGVRDTVGKVQGKYVHFFVSRPSFFCSFSKDTGVVG